MRPFDHVRQALGDEQQDDSSGDVRADIGRRQRTGTPEIIYAARKTVAQIIAGVEALIPASGRVVVSRMQDPEAVKSSLRSGLDLVLGTGSMSGVVVLNGTEPPVSGGRVAVLTAGTSDIPDAAEAALVAQEMGCSVHTTWDVGVAGIHRLVRPLEAMIDWDPDVFIVAAGMDGILPTIVTGLVPQPVVGLPVSSGYGFGGDGTGALTTMLQSCSPGVAVVNIGNGIGAGITAARIANRAALARSTGQSS